MENTMFYKDSFAKSFTSEVEFLAFVQERESNSSWKVAKAGELKFLALEEDMKHTAEIKKKFEELGKLEVITDTMDNTRLLLKTEGSLYQVRSCAIKTILERARISGNALTKVGKPVLARILNHCIKVANGNALIRFSEDKVSAVHGGDSSDYSVLDVNELLLRTMGYLANNFTNCTFAGGNYDHLMVSALWELTSEDSLVEVYKDTLLKNGIKYDEMKPALRISTSDVGICGANLYPMLVVGSSNSIISLGGPLKLEHRNKASIVNFEEKLNMIYSHYQKTIGNLTKLIEIEVENPINCMAGVMKKIGISKKLSLEAIDLFKAKNGTSICSAHDIYFGIFQVIFIMQCDGIVGTKIAQMEEICARALSIRWSEYDVPGNLKW